jgi:hypothetical protein
MIDGQDLDALVARARAWEAVLSATTAMSASQQQTIDQLVADIEAYNAATGRFDITIERAVSITLAPDDPTQERAQALPGVGGQPIYMSRNTLPGTGCAHCEPCPTYPSNAPVGYICWLEPGASGCDESCNRVCSYKCIRLWHIPGLPM